MSENLEKRLPRTGETRRCDNPDFKFGMVAKYSLVGFHSEESKDIAYVRADWDAICGPSNPNGYGLNDENGFMIKSHKTNKERDQSKRDYIDYKMPNGAY